MPEDKGLLPPTPRDSHTLNVIPSPDRAGGWTATVVDHNGQVIHEGTVGGIDIRHDNFGDWRLDVGPNGYTQPHVEEPNGGGSVLVPYVVKDGHLYVGTIRHGSRKLVAGRDYVDELPRGFSVAGLEDAHRQAATSELSEEAGTVSSIAARVRELPGDPKNMNDAFWHSNPDKGEGVHFYRVEFQPDEVIFEDLEHPDEGKVRSDLFAGVKESVTERIQKQGLTFRPVEETVVQTPDGFTAAGVGALLTAMKPELDARLRSQDLSRITRLQEELQQLQHIQVENQEVGDTYMQFAESLQRAGEYITDKLRHSWRAKLAAWTSLGVGGHRLVLEDGAPTDVYVGFPPAKGKIPFIAGRRVFNDLSMRMGMYVRNSHVPGGRVFVEKQEELATALQKNNITPEWLPRLLDIMQNDSNVKIPDEKMSSLVEGPITIEEKHEQARLRHEVVARLQKLTKLSFNDNISAIVDSEYPISFEKLMVVPGEMKINIEAQGNRAEMLHRREARLYRFVLSQLPSVDELAALENNPEQLTALFESRKLIGHIRTIDFLFDDRPSSPRISDILMDTSFEDFGRLMTMIEKGDLPPALISDTEMKNIAQQLGTVMRNLIAQGQQKASHTDIDDNFRNSPNTTTYNPNVLREKIIDKYLATRKSNPFPLTSAVESALISQS